MTQWSPWGEDKLTNLSAVIIFLVLLASNCSYPVLIFGANLGYFWLDTLFLPIQPLICLRFSNSRLRVVLKLFLFFGGFEPHCSYKIVLIKKKSVPCKGLIWNVVMSEHLCVFDFAKPPCSTSRGKLYPILWNRNTMEIICQWKFWDYSSRDTCYGAGWE